MSHYEKQTNGRRAEMRLRQLFCAERFIAMAVVVSVFFSGFLVAQQLQTKI